MSTKHIVILARGLALAGGLGVLLASSTAGAYCRTSVCTEGTTKFTAAVCDPPQQTDCGTPLFWASRCIGYSVQVNASKKVTFAQTEQVLKAAFATWAAAPCAGGTPQMVVTEAAPATCDKHEYNQPPYSNANIILYHDDSWPYEGSPNTLALTTVTYDLDTGEIYDADMELNSFDNDFTLGTTGVQFDLQSIVTHETGHFQGLAHSADMNAVMWPEYVAGTTTLRTLSPDDIAGICKIYPPTPINNDCDATPRHGFSPLCEAQQPTPSSCCTVAPGSAPGSESGRGPAGGVIAVLSALVFAARRSRLRASSAS